MSLEVTVSNINAEEVPEEMRKVLLSKDHTQIQRILGGMLYHMAAMNNRGEISEVAYSVFEQAFTDLVVELDEEPSTLVEAANLMSQAQVLWNAHMQGNSIKVN